VHQLKSLTQGRRILRVVEHLEGRTMQRRAQRQSLIVSAYFKKRELEEKE
jgi:hypothetical protein